jgi:hypothetical protein
VRFERQKLSKYSTLWQVCFSFRHISLILCRCWEHLWIGTRESILVSRTRHPKVLDGQQHFRSMQPLKTVPNVDIFFSSDPEASGSTIFSVLPWHHDLVNHLSILMSCSAQTKNTCCLKICPKRHPDDAIEQHAYWMLPGLIWILRLSYHTTGGELIRITMITTSTLYRSAVHFGSQISLTGGARQTKHIPSTPISPMWHPTYSLSYHMVLEWRPIYPSGEMWSAWGRQTPPAGPFAIK